MATECLRERFSWFPHQNSHYSWKDDFKAGSVRFGNNVVCTVPHSSETPSEEVNNNIHSEMEARALRTLSEQDYCTTSDIQKRISAVAPPKAVEKLMENLSVKGYAERVNENPSIWVKVGTCNGGPRYHGFIEMTERNGLVPILKSEDSELPLHFSHPQDQVLQTSGFSKSTSFNRSLSSPSFQKSYSAFSKTPRRKISEPARNEISKHFSRQSCRSSVSEDDINKAHGMHIWRRNSNERLRFEEFGMRNRSPPSIAESTTLDFSLLKIGSYTNETLKVSQRRGDKLVRQRRSPGVIGEERAKTNYRSRSFEESYNSRNHLHVNDRHSDSPRQRSKSFGSDGDTKSCSLCKIPILSQQQYEEHLQSTKHQNKIAKVNSEPYLKFCDYCNVGLNSKSQALEHFSSGRHEQTVAKSQKAPIRNHPPINTSIDGLAETCLTMTNPREYQLELYSKAMCSNSVCFLPTGTGKNLVSAMVVAKMLLLNPTRQIIFLVDRVLLVLQQSGYLKRELQDLKLPHSAKDKMLSNGTLLFHQQYGQQAVRPVRIGAICGEMRKLEPGIPIFSHDILVVTADCYRNHINNGTLRFEDSGLIVLDDSHHCNKDHPYNVIIRDYYRPDDIAVFDRPKILGLTASPAGEVVFDRTHKKLQRLLANLGGAYLLTVSQHAQELNEKTSHGDIVCCHSEYTHSEKALLGILMEYATKCFNLAARVSDFKEYKDVFQPSSGGTLAVEDVVPILEVIDKFSIYCKPHTIAVNALLHFQTICDAISALQECGEMIASYGLSELMSNDCPYGFEWAMEQGLPYNSVLAYLKQAIPVYSIDFMDSSVNKLISLLVETINCEENVSPFAVVMVKRNQTAYRLANYLDSSCLRARGIRTTSLIGPDPQNSLYGSPILDSTILAKIKAGHYHIVIATNLSEGGLDLPSFPIVIQLDPPSAVSALDRVRAFGGGLGRTTYVITRDGSLKRKVSELLLKEENMVNAAARLINAGEAPVCAY